MIGEDGIRILTDIKIKIELKAIFIFSFHEIIPIIKYITIFSTDNICPYIQNIVKDL